MLYLELEQAKWSNSSSMMMSDDDEHWNWTLLPKNTKYKKNKEKITVLVINLTCSCFYSII
jgi:hypothetical protein